MSGKRARQLRQLALINLLTGSGDTTAPTVTITSSESSPTAAATIPITITFSEAVTGFAVGDITVSVGSSLSDFSGSGTTYTVIWTPPAAGGVLTMDIAGGVCIDAAGNGNTAATQYTITVYGAEETDTLQPDATAGIDTNINVEAPTTNYGTNGNLICGDATAGAGTHAYRGLIKFDLSSIPSTAYIVSATLQLYESGAGNSGGPADVPINLHRVLRNWVEAQATWNIYSTGNNWGTAGAGSDGVDRVAAASASLTLDATPASDFVSWTGLGADVQSFLNGTNNNYGWLIYAPTAESIAAGHRYNTFASSDDIQSTRRPKLVVVHRDLP